VRLNYIQVVYTSCQEGINLAYELVLASTYLHVMLLIFGDSVNDFTATLIVRTVAILASLIAIMLMYSKNKI